MVANQTDESPIRVIPAAPENWPDIEALFAHNPCWCQAWRLPSGEFGRVPKGVTKDEHTAWRKEMLRRQLERPVPPGMLAYIDDRIVGWCGFGPRPDLERLVRSRTIPAVDDRPV